MKRGILCRPSSSVFFTQVKTFEEPARSIGFHLSFSKKKELKYRGAGMLVVAVATILQIIENRLMNFHRVHFILDGRVLFFSNVTFPT